jgi:hypothetical protein
LEGLQGRKFVRIQQLKYLLATQALDADLFWKAAARPVSPHALTHFTTRSPAQCRSRNAEFVVLPKLQPVLSLGHTPLANSLLTAAQLDSPEATYPLEVVFCPTCTLVQVTETVPPEVLFGNYLYFSSFSDTVLHNARTLVEQLVQRRHLDTTSLAGEIARQRRLSAQRLSDLRHSGARN